MKDIQTHLKEQKEKFENRLKQVETYTPPQDYESDRMYLIGYINALVNIQLFLEGQ